MSGAKNLVIDAFKKSLQKQIREKYAKKGLLIKVFESNRKRSSTLIEILKESNDLNTMTNSSYKTEANTSSQTSSTNVKTEDEYLKKFRDFPKGSPKHSIAIKRAHHLTNFLSEYIINAFQSSYFESPEIPEDLNTQIDSNGFKRERFSFEISNIELMPDLSALKIYWFASENENINKIVEEFFEKKLKSQIRNTLTSERVINYVPQVVFLRDETRLMLSKLDEYLMKINLENKEFENDENENQKVNNRNENVDIKKKKSINNLYGIDFNNLVEAIQKGPNSNHTLWTSTSSNESKELVKSNDKIDDQVSLAVLESGRSNKFEQKLKAYEINKRIKRERLNKSALLKISQIEFEESKEKIFGN